MNVSQKQDTQNQGSFKNIFLFPQRLLKNSKNSDIAYLLILSSISELFLLLQNRNFVL